MDRTWLTDNWTATRSHLGFHFICGPYCGLKVAHFSSVLERYIAVLLFLFFLIKTLFATYVCIEIIYTGIGMGADMHHSRRQNMQPSSEESLFRVRLNGPSAQHARIIVCLINLPPHDV